MILFHTGTEITIVRCNDLYFPKGNEHGDYYETYFKATAGPFLAYGNTAIEAANNCHAQFKGSK